VLAKAVEATSPAFEKRHHHLEIKGPRHPCVVDADAARLTQVVVNLLNNAAKYTGSNGHVSATMRSQDGQVSLEIRDDGIGISPDLLPRIFDLFVQGDQTGERGGGLGIGLAIVRSLVQLHGGTIDVHSDGVDRGSSFTVRLPAIATPPAHPQLPASASPIPTAIARQRIMIVDDNDDARMLLAEILGSLGHDVTTAGDGEAALEIVRTNPPDVAILDIGLPTMDGYELAAKLRETVAEPPFLIALTGYGQPADRARGQTAGFDRFLVKPIDIRNLVATIDSFAKA
jgi:CheY-like chemotaxis protein